MEQSACSGVDHPLALDRSNKPVGCIHLVVSRSRAPGKEQALTIRRPDRAGAGSEVGPDPPGRAATGGNDEYFVRSISLGGKTGGPDPIGDPLAVGRKARTPPFP